MKNTVEIGLYTVVSFNLGYFGSVYILFDFYKFIINYVLGLCFICKIKTSKPGRVSSCLDSLRSLKIR